MKNSIHLRTGVLILIIALGAISRFLPHPPNFTPIGAIALFGAAYFTDKKWAILIPFAALFISNLILSNIVFAAYYEGFVWFSHPEVYIAFGLIFLAGREILRKIKLSTIIGASFSASLIFFLVTNFGSWLSMGMYPMNFAGLMACYTAAIPFFWNTLAGDLFFSGLLFGAFELIQMSYPRLKIA